MSTWTLSGVVGFAVACCFLAACSGEPGLTGVEPKIGSIRGGEHVRISGRGLRSNLAHTVYFGNIRAGSAVVEGDDTLIIVTPAHDPAGIVDIRVVSGDGKTFVLPAAFTYIDQTEWNPTDTLGGGGPSKGGARKRRVIH